MPNGYRRGYGPQPTSTYDPYSKYPNFAGALGNFLANMRMMKQFRAMQEQQKWQRGMREKEFGLEEEYKEAQMEAMGRPKQPTIPARVQEAIMATDQGGVPYEEINWSPVGKKLDEWRARPEKEEIDLDNKYKQRKNLMKSLRTRLGKEVTTLKQRSKPLKFMKAEGEELTAGELTLIKAKRKAGSQLINIESALDFLGRMESSLESGAFGKRQSEALNRMMGNISGLREGTLLDELRSSWIKEAGLTPQATQRKQFRNKKTGKLDWFRWDGSKWIKE